VNSTESRVWNLLEPVWDLLQATASTTTTSFKTHRHPHQQQQQLNLLSAGVSDFDQHPSPVVTSSMPATSNDTREYSIRHNRFILSSSAISLVSSRATACTAKRVEESACRLSVRPSVHHTLQL